MMATPQEQVEELLFRGITLEDLYAAIRNLDSPLQDLRGLAEEVRDEKLPLDLGKEKLVRVPNRAMRRHPNA